MATKNVIFKFDFDTTEAKKGAKEYDKLTDGIEKKNKGLESSFKKVAQTAGAFFAVGVIKDAIVNLKNHAVALENVSAKATTVFGSTAVAQVKQWGRENAASLGLTEQGALAAAASVGDLLVPMGFTRQAAADMSTELIGLSGALSEWSGGQRSAEEVAQILAKAMLGEREQLKELGISITEADVQQRLMEKGQKKLTGTMLQQAKAVATQELIFEKSGDAQAAFAKNSDTLARTQAKVNSQIESITDRLATAAIPAFKGLLNIVSSLVPAQEKQSDLMRDQQIQLRQTTIEIETFNGTEEERRKKIEALIVQFPQLKGKIDANTVSNRELRAAVNELNAELGKQIRLQALLEQLEDARTEAKEEQLDVLAREKSIRNTLIEAEQHLGLNMDANLTLIERTKVVIEELGGAHLLLGKQLLDIGTPAMQEFAADVSINNLLLSDETRLAGELTTGLKFLEAQEQDVIDANKAITEITKLYNDELREQGKATTALPAVFTQYIDALRQTNEETTGADGAVSGVAALKKQIKELEEQLNQTNSTAEVDRLKEQIADLNNQILVLLDPKNLRQLEDFLGAFEDVDTKGFEESIQAAIGGLEDVPEFDPYKGLERRSEDAIKTVEKTEEQIRQEQRETSEDLQELLDDDAEKRRQIAELTIEVAQIATDTIFTLREEALQRELDEELEKLDKVYGARIANAEAIGIDTEGIEKEFQARREALELEAAKKRKQLALIQAIINTALAITSAATTVPYIPAGLAATILAAAAGAAQIAIISQQQFAEGTPFVEGPGTGTSDSIPARLSRGERVVTAKRNRQSWDWYEAIEAGVFDGLAPEQLLMSVGRFDDERMVDATNRMADRIVRKMNEQNNILRDAKTQSYFSSRLGSVRGHA